MPAAIVLMLVLFSALTACTSPPTETDKSPWVVRIVAAEAIKPGTSGEPEVNPGESILKITVKFQYRGPEGEVTAPVLKVTDGEGKEHIMVGNLQVDGITTADCLGWLISASHVRLGEKPETLASKTIAGCKDAVSFYFVVPENAKQPLALLFADAKPIPIKLK
jgi:hypothetical protein